MTLVVPVIGAESIWLLADRRVSYGPCWPPKDDARKVMLLETTDGVALVAYAGLGDTARRTQPTDWMCAVLRDRNLPLEQSLGVIANALKVQFPTHMRDADVLAHQVIVPAFLGKEPRLYTIDLAITPDLSGQMFRYTRHVIDKTLLLGTPKTPRLKAAGTGAPYLDRNKKEWVPGLRSVVKACDRGQVSPHAVADYLANLNHEVHSHVESVGPNCIVAWRHRKGGVHTGGGGHQFYTGTSRDAGSPFLPTLSVGMDIGAVLAAIAADASGRLALRGTCVGEELARLHKRDETLR